MKTKISTLVLLMALFGTYAFGQDCATSTPPLVNDVCTFNTSGNFTVPAGYSVTVSVQVWGGGGGGGSDSNANSGRGGGGGGGYSTSVHTIDASMMQVSTSVVVGAGGTPSIADGPTHNGGTSSFLTSSATGGVGGTGNVGGGAGGMGNARDGGSGGSGSSGNNSGGGGGGGSGPYMGIVTNMNGGNASGATGGAGGQGNDGSDLQNGGNGGNNGASGLVGQSPGGGGGGRGTGTGGSASGAGAPGRVIVTVTAVTPVELLSFSGKATPKAIQLNWETATELNNEKFEIERSADGRTFSMIGEERGQGTTQQTQAYQFTDQAPVAGLNYYRLKQMDYDGQFTYSSVTAITFTRKGAINVYPTATNGMINIVTEDEGSSLVKVFHINGSLMKQQTFDGNSLPLDISSLPNGTYLIVVETSSQTYQERIFKY
ncbi:T9SS type A sorting domain-containing protein [Lewinella cohaerens]|uniref:glycine-rich domain-containing protein n=1 Tax=Lewinella cohaerens TaxID=70995 RepID=UPI000363AE08|nr:T9SS type A sorting domain-containing protein [Lewinella cohaerens]